MRKTNELRDELERIENSWISTKRQNNLLQYRYKIHNLHLELCNPLIFFYYWYPKQCSAHHHMLKLHPTLYELSKQEENVFFENFLLRNLPY